jgi:hypothetical protein
MTMRTEGLSDSEIEAKLQRPGAGLPWPALLFVRYYVGPYVAAKADWQKETARFHETSAQITAIADKLDNGQLQKRVLVPRLRGLEDSSRYWSAAMTLEHVMIVGTSIRDIIIRLSQEQLPPGKADTARVKPQGKLPAQTVLDNYKSFTAMLMPQIESAVPPEKRDAKMKMAHPWFGPFSLRQWHWLLAEHNAIHLRQLREIAARLQG